MTSSACNEEVGKECVWATRPGLSEAFKVLCKRVHVLHVCTREGQTTKEAPAGANKKGRCSQWLDRRGKESRTREETESKAALNRVGRSHACGSGWPWVVERCQYAARWAMGTVYFKERQRRSWNGPTGIRLHRAALCWACLRRRRQSVGGTWRLAVARTA